MSIEAVTEREMEIRCPSCQGDAVYRYGKIKTGKQRFMCIVCGTQFTPGGKNTPVKGKPICTECGRQMTI